MSIIPAGVRILTENVAGVKLVNKGIYKYIWVFILYFIFALIFTWPLILNMNNSIAGHPLGEVWSHIWGLQWLKTSYLQTGTFPFQTASLNYPYGGGIFYIDPLSGLLSIPIQMVASLPFTYNFLIILNLAFGAYAAFLLANFYLKNHYAAFYAGAVYSFSAYFLSSISTGTSEAFNIGWIPLFMYCFLKTLTGKKMIYTVYSGIVLFIVLFSNFYYAEFTLMFAVFAFIYVLTVIFCRIVIREYFNRNQISGFFNRFKKPFKKKEQTTERKNGLSLKWVSDFAAFFRMNKGNDAVFQYLLILAYRFMLIINFAFSLIIVIFIRRRLLNPNLNMVAFGIELIISLIVLYIFSSALWKEFGKKRRHVNESTNEEVQDSDSISGRITSEENGIQKEKKGKIIAKKAALFMKFLIKRILPRMALIAVIACTFILPYKFIVETYMKSPDSMLRSRDSLKIKEKGDLQEKSFGANDFTNFNIYHANSIFLLNYVAAGKKNIYRRCSLQHCFVSTYSSYIGFITLFLCLIALVKAKRNRHLYFWVFTGIIFLILSLGPFCRYSSNLSFLKLTPVYKLFYQSFPFFHNIRIPQRFSLCVLLCFGIVAGNGIIYLLEGMKKTQKSLTIIVISLAMLMEITILSPAPFPLELNKIEVPEIYFRMAEDHSDFGVIESPIKRYKQGLYYQTLHGKGTILSVNDFIPDLVSGNLFIHCIYNLERGFEISPEVYSERHLRRYLKRLKDEKIKYIVVYDDLLGNKKEIVNQFLRYFLGEPEKLKNNINVYQVFSDGEESIQ